MRWSLPKAVCFIRRLYSSPSFNRQPPAKGVYNVLEAGVYRGLARYAWLRMVRNQDNLFFPTLRTLVAMVACFLCAADKHFPDIFMDCRTDLWMGGNKLLPVVCKDLF